MVGSLVAIETIKSEVIKFGMNNIVEISRNKAFIQGVEKEFVMIRRGHFNKMGHEKDMQTLTFPQDKELVDELLYKIKNITE